MGLMIPKKFTLVGVAQKYDYSSIPPYARPEALGLKNDDAANMIRVTIDGALGDGFVDVAPGEYIKIGGQCNAITANGTGILRTFGCLSIDDLPDIAGIGTGGSATSGVRQSLMCFVPDIPAGGDVTLRVFTNDGTSAKVVKKVRLYPRFIPSTIGPAATVTTNLVNSGPAASAATATFDDNPGGAGTLPWPALASDYALPLSGTPANLSVAPGNYLELRLTQNGAANAGRFMLQVDVE